MKLFRAESLARARKRVKANLKRSALELVYRNIMRDGMYGYQRERKIYG